MLKKMGVSLLAAMMLSSVALACDHSSIDDEDFLCDFSLVDDGGNKQESKQEERKVLKFDKEVVEKRMMQDGLKNTGELSLYSTFFIMADSYDPRMQNILDCHLADGSISDEVIDGINLKTVIAKAGTNFWDAFGMMDFYLKTPNGAERLNSLKPIGSRFPNRHQ